jgi:hypothetical protein
MFEILIEYWNGYKSNNMSLPVVPAKCEEIINEYFISSDDFYTWFIDNYELGDATTDFVYVADIHTNILSSTFYYNLNKNNQKEYRSRDFAKKIEQSIFLKNNHKLRNQRFNGLKLTKNAIIGYRIKPYTIINGNISDIDTEITIAYP